MKKTKMQKGITLIALIVTIVILLILATVSIQLLMNGGIITHAENAVEKYEIEQEKEKITLAVSEAYMAGLGKITEENLVSALDENIGAGKYSIDSSNSEYFKVTIAESGREYKVYKDGRVEGPTGGTGSVEVLGKAEVGIKVEKNSTINGEKYSSTNPIIPAGFTAINTSTSEWNAEGGPEIDKGLVIRDESGNEFVWVPVSEDISTTQYNSQTNYSEPSVIGSTEDSYGNPNYTYDAVGANLERANCEDIDADGTLEMSDFEIELKSIYKEMAESINKYDGFYVGRFETSRNGPIPQSKRSTAVSGSGEEIITAHNSSEENDWYGLYALNKRYSTSSVQGSMIWGIQYDKMMEWMGNAAETTIGDNRNKNRTCGTAPEDVIKNVYDLYGNCSEWTNETLHSKFRVVRGGSYFRSDSPSYRYDLGIWPSSTAGGVGSRLALYVM